MPIDYITIHDWSRSYVLPEHVSANIPLRGSIGGLGAHHYARALLVEVCRYTRATPLALHYAEAEVPGDGQLLVITATATRLSGSTLTVTTRTRNRRTDNCDGDWSIVINGVSWSREDRRYPPSPPLQGFIVSRRA